MHDDILIPREAFKKLRSNIHGPQVKLSEAKSGWGPVQCCASIVFVLVLGNTKVVFCLEPMGGEGVCFGRIHFASADECKAHSTTWGEGAR